ncbi:alpha-L-fucosidase [Niabella drilacis]|uniref:alpha-L-fucosidase n=1 Tax=Niabella drilacis (strain DSM 25811 / CCM 8410 / CCUG 62505 / LMG 26954 / E90) TaxID=1285928 RepID=A0A1G7AMR6_NIADE|nr:alpha-L-fucosidase [Niabella drilacis]SDE16082.1 alpha-L-fucosidase [Niabella drilacis]
MKKIVVSSFLCIGLSLCGIAQKTAPPAPVYPVPSARQLAWHQLETYAFIHFTTNTFTDKEWGFGDEDPKIFNPLKVDADQWAAVLKQTGFKAMILTTKHHDGFTLWPSKYTDHSVKNSPWKNGKGDVVKEASDAARKAGLKFGVYLSPWDRNRADYGSPSYITYYRNQLKELFTTYGPIFEMWFDGANGGDGYYGGTNEKRKINGAAYYDWPATLKLVRSMQPNVLFFSDAGPDIRWVGNESGVAGATNWNSITPDTLYAGKAGITGLLNTGSADGTKWIPAEVDVSIRPGWFYHASEDSKVKTPEQLFNIYLTSVGRGSNLLLNIPPDRNGVFHPTDVAALEGFKKLLDERLTHNLAKQARVKASNVRGHSAVYNGAKITDGDRNTYWATDDGVTKADVEVQLPAAKKISYVLLQEYIALGQRISGFVVEAQEGGSWKEIATGTTIGYKRILKIDPVVTSRIRLRITGSKAAPLISNLALY